MEAEYQKLSKACPKCGEPLYLETEYIAAGYKPNPEDEYMMPMFRPSYSVKCRKCEFCSTHYKSPLQIYDHWDCCPAL